MVREVSAQSAGHGVSVKSSATFRPIDLGALSTGRLERVLRNHGVEVLGRGVVTSFQINMGKLCNQACHHCHVDAGPRRSEIMEERTIDRILEILRNSPTVEVVDITGGAPELNPHFEKLAKGSFQLGKKVIVRCNLTVLFEPGMERLGEIYRRSQAEIVASLPCYLESNVDKQRGQGVFAKSIEALRLLNRLGYGKGDSSLQLHLVYNPLGASLPPPQEELERAYKKELLRCYGIRFNQLFTITNMPISRFAEQLSREGRTEEYMELLVNHFNPETLPNVMCRYLVSISWDGKVYDCDFNQMLELPAEEFGHVDRFQPPTVWDFSSLSELEGRRIRTADHCLGCTAGEGSSCSGSLS